MYCNTFNTHIYIYIYTNFPGIKVGLVADFAISHFRYQIGDLGRCKMDKQLQCGISELGSDV
jgi:hypothetical protein